MFKNIALLCDDIWEGVHNGYASILKVGEKYRMYYRAAGGPCPTSICVAESRDGITFEKPDIGIYEAGGIDIAFCDENGKELEGYSSYTMFGDSTNRPVEFGKPLSALNGTTMRLKFRLCDAYLYSFVFE